MKCKLNFGHLAKIETWREFQCSLIPEYYSVVSFQYLHKNALLIEPIDRYGWKCARLWELKLCIFIIAMVKNWSRAFCYNTHSLFWVPGVWLCIYYWTWKLVHVYAWVTFPTFQAKNVTIQQENNFVSAAIKIIHWLACLRACLLCFFYGFSIDFKRLASTVTILIHFRLCMCLVPVPYTWWRWVTKQIILFAFAMQTHYTLH